MLGSAATILLLLVCSSVAPAGTDTVYPVVATGLVALGLYEGGGVVSQIVEVPTDGSFLPDVSWELGPHGVSWLFLVAGRYPGFFWRNSRVVHIDDFYRLRDTVKIGRAPPKQQLLRVDGVIRADRAPMLRVVDVVHEVGAQIGAAGWYIDFPSTMTDGIDGGAVVVHKAVLVIAPRCPHGYHYRFDLYVSLYGSRGSPKQ